MTYTELVEKMKVNAPLTVQEVSAEQMCRLYLDRHLKYVQYDDCKYEVNFISIADTETHIYEMVKPDDDFIIFSQLIELFVKNLRENKRSFIIFSHREYEVVLELMESKE